jgi:GNAT superfamily N-acetyltransferase
MITIRECRAEDVPGIARLSQQLGYSITEEQTLKNINALQNDHHQVYVAVDDKVIGWMGLSCTVSVESPPGCEIHGLVVDEGHRGKGIGKMFIEKAKEWSMTKGVNRLRLRCNVKRTDAHRFYSNAGFSETKQQKVFDISL